MKLKVTKSADGRERRVFFCPGCDGIHGINETWGFNGDLEKPTFTPSILCNASHPESRCHSFVTNGQIQFLSDCYHALAGKTVPLPDLPDWVTQ